MKNKSNDAFIHLVICFLLLSLIWRIFGVKYDLVMFLKYCFVYTVFVRLCIRVCVCISTFKCTRWIIFYHPFPLLLALLLPASLWVVIVFPACLEENRGRARRGRRGEESVMMEGRRDRWKQDGCVRLKESKTLDCLTARAYVWQIKSLSNHATIRSDGSSQEVQG